jgi:hypothetical protein
MDESDNPFSPVCRALVNTICTYAPADNILYNLGLNALTSMAEPQALGSWMSLTPLAAIHWTSLNINVV